MTNIKLVYISNNEKDNTIPKKQVFTFTICPIMMIIFRLQLLWMRMFFELEKLYTEDKLQIKIRYNKLRKFQ